MSAPFKSSAQHTRFSERIKADINQTGEDVLQKIKAMDQETSNNILLLVLNDTIKGINELTCELQEIIVKSNEEELSNSNLKAVVKKFSQDCNDLVQDYENDRGVLKQKFEIFIRNILRETDGLFNIIKMDELHAHKHELVEAFKEILCVLSRIQIRIQLNNYSVHQLAQLIDEISKQHLDDVSNVGPESFKNSLIHVLHSSKHAFELGYYLNKVASNYDGEIQQKILDAAKLFVIATAELMRDINNMEVKNATAYFKKECEQLWFPFKNLLHLIENQPKNKKVSKNLKDLIMHIVSYGMVAHIQTGKSIKIDST